MAVTAVFENVGGVTSICIALCLGKFVFAFPNREQYIY